MFGSEQHMSKVRIKDIAAFARVSVGTVDRVIHKRGEVSESTRERIEQLLKEFNYKPDIAARSLALKREIHLAVLMPDIVNDHMQHRCPLLSGRRLCCARCRLFKAKHRQLTSMANCRTALHFSGPTQSKLSRTHATNLRRVTHETQKIGGV